MTQDIEDFRMEEMNMPIIGKKYSDDQVRKIDLIINELNTDLSLSISRLGRKVKFNVPEIAVLHRYNQLVNEKVIKENKELEYRLVKKKGRVHSGVEVIAVSTYPEGKFVGCPANCHYCPKEPEKYFNVKIISVKNDNDFIIMNIQNVEEEDLYFSKVLSSIYWEEKEIKLISTILIKKNITIKFHKSQFNNSIPKENDIVKGFKTAQPRSYLSSEPAVARANQTGWSCVSQFRNISKKRIMCGHKMTKVEGIVIGGTWSFYPKDYQNDFIRDYYYAANTLYDDIPLRKKYSLEDEIKINETTRCRVIGLTLETRPDFITKKEIIQLRKYGCTRVQLGIQHIDDDILNYINRGCNHSKSVKAIKILKDAGFKVDIHLMPDLPGSNFIKDLQMFEHVLNHEELQAD